MFDGMLGGGGSGMLGSGRKRRSRSSCGSASEADKQRAAAAFRRRIPKGRNLPVWPNWFPYTDLLVDGKLRVGEYEGMKSRTRPWSHRGTVLLYRSVKTEDMVAYAHHLEPDEYPRQKIIGVGELMDTHPFTRSEELEIVMRFNNLKSKSAARRLMNSGRRYIGPFPFVYCFRNLKRFEKEIPFTWPQGPMITWVPVKLVATELRKVGYDVR